MTPSIDESFLDASFLDASFLNEWMDTTAPLPEFNPNDLSTLKGVYATHLINALSNCPEIPYKKPAEQDYSPKRRPSQ